MNRLGSAQGRRAVSAPPIGPSVGWRQSLRHGSRHRRLPSRARWRLAAGAAPARGVGLELNGFFVGPIFTARAISGQVVQAEAAQQAVPIGYEASVQNAFADFDKALVAHQKLGVQLHAQSELVKASREPTQVPARPIPNDQGS